MRIYEKVARRLKNVDWNISSIIKSSTLTRVKKDMELLQSSDIIYGIEPLSYLNLIDFYQNIYSPIIGHKENAQTHGILKKLTPEEITNSNRFFIFIRKWDTLLWWAIFNHIHNVLKFSYKANLKEDIQLKEWLWTLIDFLFFSFWIENNVDSFSYWVDRNWYGEFWPAQWLCLHKLMLWFAPYTFKANDMIDIDANNIHKSTIIFNHPNEDWMFDEVIFLNSNDINTNIFQKKWFTITPL